MLVGKALGDAGLILGKGGGIGFKIEHALAAKDYVLHQWAIQNKAGFVFKEPFLTSRYDTRYNKQNNSVHFSTGIQREFMEFSTFILSQNPFVRGLPINIEDLLTPIALAFWIMDDGQAPSISKKYNKVYQGLTLCTDSYSAEQVRVQQQALINRYKFKVNLNKKNDNLRLYIGRSSIPALRELVLEHMIESQKYKLR